MYRKILARIILISAISLIMSIALSCTSAPEKPSVVSEKTPQVKEPSVKQDQEVEWEKVLKEARKENKLVIYLSDTVGASREPLTKAMKQNFNLDTEIVVARLAEHAARVMNERKAGIFYPDLMMGGAGVIAIRLKSEGVIKEMEPSFILPEIKEARNWHEGKLPWVDKEKHILGFGSFIQSSVDINTSLVKKEELTSYSDLLNPKWKGKISMNDPTIAGQGAYWFHMVNLLVGRDFFIQLIKQEPVIVRDQRLQVEWLAQGKYPISLGSASDFVSKFRKEGASVDSIILKEGTAFSSGASNLMLVNNAPHPNVVKVFINWFLGKEGQSLWVKTQTAYFSRRIDVSAEHLDPIFVPGRPGIKYIDMGTEERVLDRSKYVEIAQEMFATLKR